MDAKQDRLDSLRRVAQRLRQIEGDAFAENMAQRLEAEISRTHADDPYATAAADTTTNQTSQWDWNRSDYVATDRT